MTPRKRKPGKRTKAKPVVVDLQQPSTWGLYYKGMLVDLHIALTPQSEPEAKWCFAATRHSKWDELEKDGYRCVRVRIEEV